MKKLIKQLFLFFLIILLVTHAKDIARQCFPVKYLNLIKTYSEKYAVDPHLIMGIIKTESNFNTDAVSPKNATGLMQIIKPTAKWLATKMKLSDFNYEQVKDPELNIQMGCYYISYLLKQYDGDVKNALAAYNAGEGNVNRWLKNETFSNDGATLIKIPYKETQQYIKKVTGLQKIYRFLY